MVVTCPFCAKECPNYQSYRKHLSQYLFYPCLTCAEEFGSLPQLEQHCDAKIHRPPPLSPESRGEKLQLYLQDAYYKEKVMVTRTDRKKSRKLVQSLLEKRFFSIGLPSSRRNLAKCSCQQRNLNLEIHFGGKSIS